MPQKPECARCCFAVKAVDFVPAETSLTWIQPTTTPITIYTTSSPRCYAKWLNFRHQPSLLSKVPAWVWDLDWPSPPTSSTLQITPKTGHLLPIWEPLWIRAVTHYLPNDSAPTAPWI